MTFALSGVKGYLVDLDGVTYIGQDLAPGAADFWQYTRAAGVPVAFVTNSSASAVQRTYEKLLGLGLDGVVADQIFPATRATALYLAQRHPGARVFLIGEQGLADELTGAGATLVEADADFVVVGVDRQLCYPRMERACDQVLAGAGLIVTSGDHSYPTEYGRKPGAYPFAAFIEMVTGTKATLVGKPQAEMLRQALRYMGLAPDEVAMVGDTPETDLVAARRAGTRAVLIGDRPGHPLVVELTPELICQDLGELTRLLQAQ